MPYNRERSKRVFRKITDRLQKQRDIPTAAPSTNITSIDSPAAARNDIQQEQTRDSFPSTYPTSHHQPPAAKSLWDRAYDALAMQNPGLVKDYDELLAKEEQMTNSTPNETTPSPLPAPHDLDTRSDRSRRLDTVIQNGLRRMEDSKTTFRIAGHEFVLKDQITTAAHFLLWSKDWIGTAVRNSPEASLVWSGACLILPLLTNPVTAAEANQGGFAYVTSRLRYYVALEPMLRQLGQNARVKEALISVANDHIVDLYQAILEFQLSSVLRFYRSRLQTYLDDIAPSRDWGQTRLDIKTLEDIVNSDLGQINDLAARQELENLNKTSEDMHVTMETMLSVATQQLAVLKEQLAAQLAAQEDAKQERVLAEQRKCLQAFWLTQNGSGATYDWYKSRVELRVEGTCNWFLQHENFQEWLSQESGPLLVSADPGCGKSVLAKYLVDHELAQQSAIICYFFFKDQDQNTIRQALCALLHQLLSQNSALIQHAMELYNRMGAELIQSEPSLWTILRDAVRDPQAGRVIFVIDALDECDESQLISLVSNLEDIFCDQQLANAKFKVLMTSRPYEQVVRTFYKLQDVFQHVHIPGEEEFETISQEINSVIRHRVNQLAKKHRLSDKIKSSLNSKLLAIDHRTYLWVYLVFDYLDEKGFKKTDDGIDAAIQTLPKSVYQAYDQILNKSKDNEAVMAVKKALSIILAARRPLTVSEMNIAMSLDGQSRGRSIYDLDLEQDVDFKTRLRTLCGLFVNVHHDKIYFLHQTAREFLIQSLAPTTVSSDLQWHRSITARHAHSVLAEVCMFYLDMLNSTHRDAFHRDDHQGAFSDYSTRYWDDHCRKAEFEKGSAMVDLALKLCTPDLLTNHSRWARIATKQYDARTWDLTSHSRWAGLIPWRSNIRPGTFPNVLIASQLGLTHVTELLLKSRAYIEARSHHNNMTALSFAAQYGYEDVTRLLLEFGANVEAKASDSKTALMYAADFGHDAVTRLLLDNGANVQAKDNRGWTTLMYAAHFGHYTVARLLLNNGVDVEAKEKVGGFTVLLDVAQRGYEDITRLLLENGANVEAKDIDGKTALMFAAHFGHDAVVRRLLDNGANVEAKDNRGWTALRHAATSTTQLLIDKGAQVKAEDDESLLATDTVHRTVWQQLLGKADVQSDRKGPVRWYEHEYYERHEN